MKTIDCTNRYCIVGAGSSGLVAAKTLLEHGIEADVIEREDCLGGNWAYGKIWSAIYESTHTISSKKLTEYTDFKMPSEYPQFPHHSQVLEYLKRYAVHFDLEQHIEYSTSVESITPDGATVQIILSNGERRLYRGVLIGNGHNWDPRWPEFPGEFSGEQIHSRYYKTPDIFKGKRVLIIGAGNSGCDIAVEAANHADVAFHSVRRGYHYIPKFILGKPSDVIGETLLRSRMPLWMRRTIAGLMIRLQHGNPRRFGLSKPDHKLFEAHPIINSQLFYCLGHGRLNPKPNVKFFDGREVQFDDGSTEEIDLIVNATGFKISFPFLDQRHLNWKDGKPNLFLNVFHPEYDNLFVIGLIQPDSGQFGLVDYQCQLIARFLRAQLDHTPHADRFRKVKANPNSGWKTGIRYLATPRNLLEVEHFSYRRNLQKLINRFPKPSHNSDLPHILQIPTVPEDPEVRAKAA